MDVIIVLVVLGGSVVACFMKGKPGLAVVGGLGFVPLMAEQSAVAALIGSVAVFGAVRLAKPGSTWAKNFYSKAQRNAARLRFGETPEEIGAWSELDGIEEQSDMDGKADTEAGGRSSNPGPAARTLPTFEEPIPDAPASPASSPPANQPPENRSAREAIEAFLAKARGRGVIDHETHVRLREMLGEARPQDEPVPTVRPSPPPPARKTPPPAPPKPAPPPPKPKPAPPPAKPVARPHGTASLPAKQRPVPSPVAAASEPVPSRPTAGAVVRARLNEIWELIGPDISIHGFLYLGLLLTFVGVFGFMFVSFEELEDAQQPYVEILIPVIFFGWAWWLKRRGANVVAHTMAFLAGLLLPIVVFAGLVDSAPVPPDLTGGWLIVGLAVVSLLIAAIYAWWSARHPDSWLRFLVAPMVWVAAMAPGFAFKTDERLAGDAITRLVSAQPAMAAAAIAITLLVFTRRPQHRLAAPSFAAAVVGVPITYLLTVSLAAGESWAYPAALVLAGASALVSAELLGRHYEMSSTMAVVRPFLIAVALAPLVPIWGIAWTGLIAVIAYLAVLEWEVRPTPDVLVVVVAAGGVAAGLAMTLSKPWLAVVAWAIAAVWAHVRRITGLPIDEADQLLTLAAGFLPIGVALGLVWALPDGAALVVIGIVLVAVTGVVRWFGADDVFWRYWLTGAGGALTAGTAFWYIGGGAENALWAGAAASLLAAATLGAAPGWPAARVWMTSASAAVALGIGLNAANVPDSTQPAWWAIAGLGAVIVAMLWSHPAAAHLATIGHLVGLGALIAVGTEETRVVTLSAWSIGWLVAVFAVESGRPSSADLLVRGAARWGSSDERFERAVVAMPSAILALSIPFAMLATLGLWDRFADNRAWTGVALALLAVGYAAVVGLQPTRRPLALVFAVGAVVLSVVGVAVAAPAPWPSIVAVSSVLAVAWLVATVLDWTLFTWFAWAMSGVLAVLLANRAGVPVGSLHFVVLVWGVVLTIGGLALDDVRAGRRERGEGLRVAWLRHPVVLGSLAIPLGLAPIYTESPAVFGRWSLAAAAGYAVIAILLRAGAVTAPAYALAAFGVIALSPWPAMEQPLVFVPVAGALALASWAAEVVQARHSALDRYLRWDIAPLVVAHVVALAALVRAVNVESIWTWIGVGALSVAVGAWKRQRAWVDAGNILVLVAAAAAGQQWMALALAGTSLRGIFSVPLTTGFERLTYHALGVIAAAAAWVEVGLWLGWSTAEVVSYTALAFGGLAALVGGLLGWRGLEWDWAAAWGGLAVVGVGVSMVLAPGNVVDVYPALGTSLFALGAGLSTRRIGHWGMQAVTVAAVGVAWAELVAGVGWGVEEAVSYTSLAAGLVAVGAAGLLRFGWLSRSWTIAWGSLALTGIGLAWYAALTIEPVGIEGPVPAIGLAMLAAATMGAARPVWPPLHYCAIGITGWAWAALALGLGWDLETIAVTTAITFGVLGLAVPEVARSPLGAPIRSEEDEFPAGVARAWLTLGGAGVLVAAVVAANIEELLPAWLAVAVGLALIAFALARGATPLRWPPMRELSGLVALAAGTALGYGIEASATQFATAAILIGVGATSAVLWLWQQGRKSSPWLWPLGLVGIAATLEALAFAVAILPEFGVMALVLLGIAVQVTAAGIILERPGLLALGPPIVLAAWVGVASEAVTGSALWFTVPIAVVLIAEVDIARWSRRRAEQPVNTTELIALEWGAVGLLAAVVLVEMFASSVAYSLLAFAISGGLFIWAAATRVRRRAVAAAVLATVTAVLTIFAAAAGAAPTSAFFWIVAAGTGFAVMLAMGLIEAYRSKTGAVMRRFDEVTEGWE